MTGVRPAAITASFVIGTALCGCAAVPARIDPTAGDTLSGRLAIRVDAAGSAPARALSAAFELQGDARDGRLNLLTPLGSILAEARWDPGHVVLVTPHGTSRFADLDALTREVLGESVPVAALFDWLRGRPWAGAASMMNATPTAGNAAAAEPGFQQLGWSVSLARFDEAWVAARREQPPVVTVRARLDRP